MTKEKYELQKGWEAASRIYGTGAAAAMTGDYVFKVNEAISAFEKTINSSGSAKQLLPTLRGFIFEDWAAGTFNIDAVASRSKDWADVPKVNTLNSVDINLRSGMEYSAKAWKSGESSGLEQAGYDPITGKQRYEGMGRLVPEDQLEAASKEVHKRYLKNMETRPKVSEVYRETEALLTDRISNKEGVESKSISKSELDQIAKERRTSSFKASEHGVTADSSITVEYMLKEAGKAGLTAAVISAAIRTAPELVSIFGCLIRHEELEEGRVAKLGKDALSSTGTGFIRGSVTSILYTECAKGTFGEAFVKINPSLLGVIVSLVIETGWNSIQVARGKMTPLEMGDAFARSAVTSVGYLVGAKIGAAIGQAIGFAVPFFGFIVGSIMGAGASIAYSWTKKKVMSLCIDTGFTCFGLVEQDYSIPPEVMRRLGIPFAELEEAILSTAELETAELETASLDYAELDKIEFYMPRRGLIGVNKVGYIAI